ncbi:putative metal-binding motif-containing protein [Fulvivirga maritima]|uniref:putative metal-binding motif-containing protein n=1 Tax=Fulvivirga maritima TaxID=2904247 RepID=UPI001F2D0BAA|nr:putative metal-binding motif-containing protein [Fulvivirga maritima]UII24910.1 putative metal-binding motif-containing protein [Fulvivirga maritima]
MKRLLLFLPVLLAGSFLISCGDDDDACTPTTWYRDADGDGFGDASDMLEDCVQPEGYVMDNTDCDDSNADINPGAEEDDFDGIDSNCDGTVESIIIWTGPNLTFNKPDSADWTDPQYQDKITEKVTFTRQHRRQLYNYQWWQDTFSQDADDQALNAEFWNDTPANFDFTPTGGTKGVKWALLDNTGGSENWDPDFPLYGTLGDTTHFYSFHNIGSFVRYLENGSKITEVLDNFTITTDTDQQLTGTSLPDLEGKKLGVWLVEENIFFTLTFTKWGSGDQNPGGGFTYERSTKQY